MGTEISVGVDKDAFVAALQTERAGYVARGLDDRVAAVDEQLALLGARQDSKPAGPVAGAQERAVPSERKERR